MLPVQTNLLVFKENHERITSVYIWRQRVIKMSIPSENWFEQTNKYKYLELMCIMTNKYCTMLKEIHRMLKGSELWVDMERFVKSNKQFNPSSLFELFGSFSSQTANDVCNCLMGWIYDNYNSVKGRLRMALLHKKGNSMTG